MNDAQLAAAVDCAYEDEDGLAGVQQAGDAEEVLRRLHARGMTPPDLLRRLFHSRHADRLVALLRTLFNAKQRLELLKGVLDADYEEQDMFFSWPVVEALAVNAKERELLMRRVALSPTDHPLGRQMDAWWARRLDAAIAKGAPFRSAWNEIQAARSGFHTEEEVREALTRGNLGQIGAGAASKAVLGRAVRALHAAMVAARLLGPWEGGERHVLESDRMKVSYDRKKRKGGSVRCSVLIPLPGLSVAKRFTLDGFAHSWPLHLSAEGAMTLAIAAHFDPHCQTANAAAAAAAKAREAAQETVDLSVMLRR